MVLLKNDGAVLPFSPGKKTAVIGPLGNDKHDMLGPWWGQGRDQHAVSVFEGIKAQDANTTYTPMSLSSTSTPPNGVIDPAHRHLTAGNELRPEVSVVRRDHLHVGAGVQRLARGVGTIGRDAMPARTGVRVDRRTGAQLGRNVQPRLLNRDVLEVVVFAGSVRLKTPPTGLAPLRR